MKPSKYESKQEFINRIANLDSIARLIPTLKGRVAFAEEAWAKIKGINPVAGESRETKIESKQLISDKSRYLAKNTINEYTERKE